MTSDGWESLRLRNARVSGEVVHRKLHRLPASQARDLFDEQFVLQRLRRVEVHPCALLRRQVREVTIIAIETEYLGLQRALEVLGQSSLSCTGRPGDANEVDLGSHEQDSLAHVLQPHYDGTALTLSWTLLQITLNLRQHCSHQGKELTAHAFASFEALPRA